MIKNTLLSTSFISLILFSVSALSEQKLDSAEIQDLFGNKTVSAYSEIQKAPVSLFYDLNGEVRGVFSNGKMGTTKWWVKDNGHICLKSKKGDLCFKVVVSNSQYQKYLVKENGSSVLAFSMEKFTDGNTNNY